MNITINITEPIKRVQEFREYDLGQITTTLQDLLDNSSITIESNIIPILKVLSVDNIVKNYLIKDLTENLYNTQDYITGQDLTEDDLILFVSESQILDLQNKLEDALIIQQSTFMGIAEPAATPTGTGNRYWVTVTPGTYTNFGGVVVAANSMAIISRSSTGTFSISQTALNLTNYLQKTDNIKVEPWTAKSYASGDQVNYLGKLWQSNAATATTDVPGTSSKWVDVLSGYADLIASKNLFNKATTTDGFYLTDTNQLVASPDFCVSDFIPVVAASNYTSNFNMRFTTYFNANKVYMAGGSNSSLSTFTVPAGVAFVRISLYLPLVSKDTFQIELGTVSTFYETFDSKVPSSKLRLVGYTKTEDLPATTATYQTKRTIETTVDGFYINSLGNIVALASYQLYKYSVTVGEYIKILGVERGDVLSYCFYNSSTFSSATVVLKGQLLNNTGLNTIDVIVKVPFGATYLGVTHNNANPIFYINAYNKNNPDFDLTKMQTSIDVVEDKLDIYLNKATPIDTIADSYIGGSGALVSLTNYQVKVYDTNGLNKVRVVGGISGGVMQYAWYNNSACTSLAAVGIYSTGTVKVDSLLDVKARYLALTDITVNPGLEMDVYTLSPSISRSIYDLFKTVMELPLQKVTVVGDSLTAGAGGTSGFTYLYRLVSLLGSNYTGTNLGVGGENTLTIGARVNSIPAKLKNTITLPATATPINIGNLADSGMISSWDDSSQIKPLLQGVGSINPVIVAGVECTLGWTGANPTDATGYYTIKRNVASSGATLIQSGTPIYSYAGKLTREDDALVIYIGTNGGFSTPDELVNQIQTFIDYYKSTKIIVIGLHYRNGKLDNTSIYDLPMQKKFGSKFFNNRQYLSKYGVSDAIRLGLLPDNGTYPTAQDTIDMNNGYPPTSIMSPDLIHFNNIGYELIGRKSFEIGKNLGYW